MIRAIRYRQTDEQNLNIKKLQNSAHKRPPNFRQQQKICNMTQAEKVPFQWRKKSRCESTLFFLTLPNNFWADLGSFRCRAKVFKYFMLNLNFFVIVLYSLFYIKVIGCLFVAKNLNCLTNMVLIYSEAFYRSREFLWVLSFKNLHWKWEVDSTNPLSSTSRLKVPLGA